LSLVQRVAVADELERRGVDVAAAQQPRKLAGGGAQRGPGRRGEKPGVLRMGAAVRAMVGHRETGAKTGKPRRPTRRNSNHTGREENTRSPSCRTCGGARKRREARGVSSPDT